MSRVTQDTAMLHYASDTGLSPTVVPLSRGFSSHAGYNGAVLQPRRCVATAPVWALPRSLATTGGIISLFSLPGGTKMFQFPPLASIIRWIGTLQVPGLSHSEIRGSKVICTYPRLVAAYHVLHRLNEPRHPPYALSYFRLDRTGKPKGRRPLILSAVLSTVLPCRDCEQGSSSLELCLLYSFACVNMSKISSK